VGATGPTTRRRHASRTSSRWPDPAGRPLARHRCSHPLSSVRLTPAGVSADSANLFRPHCSKFFRPHQDRLRRSSGPIWISPWQRRKRLLPGKLQEAPAPAVWGQVKLELTWWAQFDLVGWGQEHLVETVQRRVRSPPQRPAPGRIKDGGRVGGAQGAKFVRASHHPLERVHHGRAVPASTPIGAHPYCLHIAGAQTPARRSAVATGSPRRGRSARRPPIPGRALRPGHVPSHGRSCHRRRHTARAAPRVAASKSAVWAVCISAIATILAV